MVAEYRLPLRRVTPASPCPVCGKVRWCNFTPTMVHCMGESSPMVGGWKWVKTAADGGSIYVLANEQARDFRPRYEPPAANKPSELAPVAIRDRWYRQLIRYLSLSPEHRDQLRGRGLTDAIIDARQYRTLPEKGRSTIVKRLMEMLGEEPKGIPGFFQSKKGYWLLGGQSGLLIPVLTSEGHIQGFQIRVDQVEETWVVRTPAKREVIESGPRRGQTQLLIEAANPDGEVCQVVVYGQAARKLEGVSPGDELKGNFSRNRDGRYAYFKASRYVWLSSANRANGSSPSTPLHVTQPVGAHPAHPGCIWVTEGPLKADIASQFQKDIFLAVAGVSIRQGVVEQLKELGARWAIVAFDMDGRTNPEVVKHTKALISQLLEAGLAVAQAEWDPGYDPVEETYRAKGIDDAFYHRVPVRTRRIESVDQVS